MYKMNAILYFHILFVTFLGNVLTDCPEPSVIAPCTCHEQTVDITCSGSEALDLKSIFDNLSKNSKQKHFQTFYLNNTHITEWDVNDIQDITFDTISIQATNLVTIVEQGKLLNTFLKTRNVHIAHNKHLEGHSLIKFLSSFVNIESIVEIENQLFTELPDNAFTSKNSPQIRLAKVRLMSPRSLGSHAFRSLSAVEELHFGEYVSHISENAFSFDEPSTVRLLISVIHSLLNASSFAPNALSSIKRPTHLNINSQKDNGIAFLSEQVFLPFFSSDPQNVIDMSFDPHFDCEDCRSYWVVKDGFERRLYTKCSSGKPLNYQDNFGKCKQ